MTASTQEKLRAIKLQLHAAMNGPVSNSMRDKGLHYRVIYGVEWNRLLEMAREYGKDAELAGALWKEDIRECRLLAGLIQPADNFPEDLAEIWIEGMNFPEEAQYTCMSLFQYLPYAKRAAYHWIARDNEMYQLCGFLTLSRIFMKLENEIIDDRRANEFLDQASSLIHTENGALRSAIQNALMKYALLGDLEAQQVNRILNNI